jgi:DNA-binding SARP family transcriptional activator
VSDEGGIDVAGPAAPALPGHPEALDGRLRLQVLGPLRVRRGDQELDAGPRQQAFLLALLLARTGRPTSTDELIELIWGEDAPATAVNVIHKYVGSLRRLLEPGLPARATGSFIVRSTNGYLASAGAGALDLARFRESVTAAETELAGGHHQAALDRFVGGLALW